VGTISATAAASAPQSAQKGHPIGFWFFFWGEFAERSSYYGMRAILTLYMTQRLGVAEEDGATFMSLFIAGCYLLPLLGGYVADNFFGKYWTIVGFSAPYVIGQYIVGIENTYVVLVALALLAMGSGVIKPNISTLMGLTYDEQRPGQEQLRSNAFSWFYLAINIGALISQIGVPWLRSHHGYGTAFLFPAGLMAVALIVFAAGKRFYAKEVLHIKVVGTSGENMPDGRTLTGVPIKYSVVTPEEKAADRALRWQTLQRIGSLFFLVMFFWAIFDQSASTWIYFANTYMDLHLFGIEVNADQIQFVNALFIVTLLPVSVFVFNRLAKMGFKIRPTDKMVVGFLLTATSMAILAVAGFLAGKKQDAVKITLKEGELIVPPMKGNFKEANLAAASFGDVRVAATDGKFDEKKKKWELSNAAITFQDGSLLAIKNGRIDFDTSRGLFSKAVFAPAGVLEPKFETGEYGVGSDLLVIGENNKTEIKKGAKQEAPEEKEPPIVTLEKTSWVPPAERVTAWWEILAYFVITLSEILISVTGLELAFVAAPPSMKSFVTACWLVTVGLANLFINAPITRLYSHMDPGPYFSMLAAALGVVTVIFIPLAIRFNRGMAAAKAAEQEEAAKEGSSEAV
jgi:dipeptide/tripeptide permease